MKGLYILLAYILIFFACSKCNAQLGLFKYSTYYAGIGLNATINEANTYEIVNGVLTETSSDNKHDYRFSYGVRRLARLNFEQKGKSYINGEETTWGKYRSALLNGLEYLVAVEHVRDRGISFVNQDYWLRYLGKKGFVKLQSTNLEGIDLKYKQIDARFKVDFSRFQLSSGAVARFHPAYGVNPFKNNFVNSSDYIDVANDLGYNYEFSWDDFNNNGYVDRNEPTYNYWTNPLGDTIAESNSEFLKYHYSQIVNSYNQEEISKLGTQITLSAVIGLSWYQYNDNSYALVWANLLPYNKAISDYGYTGAIDYEFGALVQKKLINNLSLYSEIVYLSYLGRHNYNVKCGLNYIIK